MLALAADLKKLFLAGAALSLVAACSVAPERDDGSDVTSVNVGLPDRGAMKTQVADIETKMNSYRLVVTPVDPACANATKIDQLDAYAASPVINASLRQGCDYDVTLELGGKDAPANPPPPPPAAQVTYEGKVKQILESSCTRCHKPGKTAPDLTTYALAKAAGADVVTQTKEATMPPSNPLAQSDRDVLKAWADGGYLEKDAPAATTTTTNVSTTTPGKLAVIYYRNNEPVRIKKEDIASKPALRIGIKVQLQQAGRDIGLGK